MKVNLRKLNEAIDHLWAAVPYDARGNMVDISMLDESNGPAIGNVITLKLEYGGTNKDQKPVWKTLVMEISADGDNLPSRMTENTVVEF